MPTPGDGPTGGDLAGDLARWLAEARVDESAASRARERWLRQQAGEEATFVGVLLDLAERGSDVIIDVAGRRPRGTVVAVAEDFCALRDERGADHLVAYAGISRLEPLERASSSGDRPHALDMTLREALVALLAERPRVRVIDRIGDDRAGELTSVGRDVVVVRADGTKRLLYVPLGSIAAVEIAG